MKGYCVIQNIQWVFKKWKTFSVFLSSYRNTSGGLGEREMLWEHKPQASVSTAFLSSPKLSRVSLLLDIKSNLNVSLCFVSGNIEILGKQNSLFPSGPVIKYITFQSSREVLKVVPSSVARQPSLNHFRGALTPSIIHSYPFVS